MLRSYWQSKGNSRFSSKAFFGLCMNKLWIFKDLETGVLNIGPMLLWTGVVHLRRESIGVGFVNKLQSNVVTIMN